MRTKLIWSLSAESFARHSAENLAANLLAWNVDAVLATYTTMNVESFRELRKHLAAARSTSSHPEGYVPFLFSLVGRRAMLSVLDEQTELTTGQQVKISTTVDFDGSHCAKRARTAHEESTEKVQLKIFVSAADMLPCLKKGSLLSLSAGQVELKIEDTKEQSSGSIQLTATVCSGGRVYTGMDVSSETLSRGLFPLLPEDDAALQSALSGLADGVVIHGIRTEQEIDAIRQRLPSWREGALKNYSELEAHTGQQAAEVVPPLVILKLDSREILELAPRIVNKFDCVFLNRSELGMSIDPHSLPVVQKEILARSNRAGKTVLVASDLMASMRFNANPTRAEVNDLANLVAEGVDAVVLGEEVTEGPFSDQVAEYTKETILNSEGMLTSDWDRVSLTPETDLDAIAYGAMRAARHAGAKAIVCLTRRGLTAARLATLHAPIDIIAVTYNTAVMRQLQILHAVRTIMLQNPPPIEMLLSETTAILAREFKYEKGDRIVFTSLSASSISDRRSNLFIVQEVD